MPSARGLRADEIPYAARAFKAGVAKARLGAVADLIVEGETMALDCATIPAEVANPSACHAPMTLAAASTDRCRE